MGLVGDSDVEEKDFSFLQKRKFLKGGLAAKFIAQIIWESGGKSENIRLNEKEEKSDEASVKPKSVRYIPQNHFEQLTNDLDISKFQELLEEIIFNYLSSIRKCNFLDILK